MGETNSFLLFLFGWWPWVNFTTETFVLQFIILYCLYSLISNNNIYYNLLLLLIVTFFFGIYLSVYQLELYTAFLWLIELSVFFVFLLLLFFVNIKGSIFYKNSYILLYALVGLYLIFAILYIFDFTCQTPALTFSYLEDYYSAFSTRLHNDFYGLFSAYYYLNSMEFIIIGVILLVGSVFCIFLLKIGNDFSKNAYIGFFKIFNFFRDYINSFFLKKQNLTKQGNKKETIKIYKKK